MPTAARGMVPAVVTLTVQVVLVASVLYKQGVLPTSILNIVHYCCVAGY